RVAFVDRLTFRLSDTEGSASKQRSPEAIGNAFEIVEQMLSSVPPELRIGLLRKRAALYHDASTQYLLDGRLTEAWQMHLTSIFNGGWRYFSYTRHLVRRTCAPWMAV